MQKIQYISVDKIKADPKQPRQEFIPAEMHKLEKSVKERGILQPIIVEKQGTLFVIVDGERRYKVSKSLGLKIMPCVVYEKMDSLDRLIMRFHLQEQHILLLSEPNQIH